MIFVVTFGDKTKINKNYHTRNSSSRADILDRNNLMVATNLKTKSLYLSTILINENHDIGAKLASIFSDISAQEVNKKIANHKNNRSWILIKRNLTPKQVEEVKNLKIAALIFEDDSIRVYPQKELMSHLVGYVDTDSKGLAGLEMYYEKQLFENYQNLQLAADVRVQDIVRSEMLKACEEFKVKAASAIVMDVNNGEIIAMTSLPDFNLNIQNEADSEQKFNRATYGVYELGSIFKIFTNAIAFEEKLVKINDVFDVSEPIKYARFSINDDHKVKDQMTTEEVFLYSSNIGTVQIAQKIGEKKQKEYLKKFFLLDKIDADYPSLGKPIYPKIWREISLFTISYGHGIAVSPLHIAASTAAMVNGGIYFNPSFIKLNEKPRGERIISENTSKIMRKLMRATVEIGTGKKSDIKGYQVAGKTGTANKAESGSYNEKSTIASFVATFPVSKPRYLVYAVFDKPNYTFNTGGMVAAPAVGRIIKNIAPILNVEPNFDEQKSELNNKFISYD